MALTPEQKLKNQERISQLESRLAEPQGSGDLDIFGGLRKLLGKEPKEPTIAPTQPEVQDPGLQPGIDLVKDRWEASNQAARDQMDRARQSEAASYSRLKYGTEENPKNVEMQGPRLPEERTQAEKERSDEIIAGVTGQGLLGNKITPISDISRKASGKLMNIATETPGLTAEQGAKMLDQGVGAAVTRKGLASQVGASKVKAGEKLGEVAKGIAPVKRNPQLENLQNIRNKYIDPDTGMPFIGAEKDVKYLDDLLESLQGQGMQSGASALAEKSMLGKKVDWTNPQASLIKEANVARNQGLKAGMEESAAVGLKPGQANPVTESMANYEPLAEASKSLSDNPTNLSSFIKRFAKGAKGNIGALLPGKTISTTAPASVLHKTSKLPIDKGIALSGVSAIAPNGPTPQEKPPVDPAIKQKRLERIKELEDRLRAMEGK